VSAVRFSQDGLFVAATSSSKKMFVIDVETGKDSVQYDNCVYGGRDRTALAAPASRDGINYFVSSTVDGKGLVYFDRRVRQPVKELQYVRIPTVCQCLECL